MIRQTLIRALPLLRVPAPGHRQAGSSAARLAIVLGILSALILVTAVYLFRDRTLRPLPSMPTQPPGQTVQEKMQAADRLVSRIISSLSLNEEHLTLEQVPRKKGELSWNENVITISLPHEISLHQVEHATAGARQFFEAEGLRADTVYESDLRLRIAILVEEQVTHRLLFQPAPPPLPPHEPGSPESQCRIALVIDDLGENYRSFKELEALEVPITYAILPFRTHSVKIAEEIHAHNSGEIILHLPLEPWNSANHAMNHGTLRTSMDREELLEQLERNIRAVPHLAGVSNHMGSKFTEDSEKMTLLLEALKEKELYFLDSRTSKKTVGHRLAGKLLLKTAQRDLFLDNNRDRQSIEKQLQKILPLAQRRGGKLIVIGHPYKDTMSALKEHLPLLKEQGITFVPLSELVH